MRERQEHFTDAQWADFIRDTSGPEAAAAMREHLAAGCADCSAAHALFTDLRRMGQEPAVEPGIVARAKSAFQPAAEDWGWVERLRAVAATLVREMRQDWVPAGIRSGAAPSQRMLFRAGDYSLDLNLDAVPEAGRRELVGQIANERDRQENVEGIVVQVVCTGRTLGETSTNRFGEFVVEYPQGKAVMLRLALRARGERIEVPLNGKQSHKK